MFQVRCFVYNINLGATVRQFSTKLDHFRRNYYSTKWFSRWNGLCEVAFRRNGSRRNGFRQSVTDPIASERVSQSLRVMGQHISEISFKATKTLGFLCKNMIFAPRSRPSKKLHTKLWFGLNYRVCSTHLEPLLETSDYNQIGKVQWTRNTSSVVEMLHELKRPSLKARMDQSSLLLFHKIHCGAVSMENTRIWPLLTVRKLPGYHIVLNIVDTRHTVTTWRFTFYPELLHIGIVPRTIPHWNRCGIVCFLPWQIPIPQRKHSPKVFCMCVFFFKIRTPWIMFRIERVSI